MKLRMLRTVRPACPFLTEPGTELVEGQAYEALRDHRGILYGICANGQLLPVGEEDYDWAIDERSTS